MTIEGGTLRIAGRFSGTGTTQIINFNMSGGTMTVGAVGNAGSRGTFDIPASGSSFTMSGGTIILQTASTNATPIDYRNVAGTANITGGTVQFGNSSTTGSPTFYIGAAAGLASKLPNVVINSTGTPTVAPRTQIVVYGNWTNNSAFAAGTNSVAFSGTSPQTIGGSSAKTFADLFISSAAQVTFPSVAIPSAAGLTNFGTIIQTLAVNGSSDVNFIGIGGYGGVTINANSIGTQDLGSTTVAIRGNQACDTQNTSVRRCFDINPTNKTGRNATITFYFASAEVPITQTCTSLQVWHWTGSMPWELAGTSGTPDCTSTPRSVQVTGVASFSPFVLSSGAAGPTAITLTIFSGSTPTNDGLIAVIVLAAAALLAGVWVLRRRTQA
jgi:hypothetical protein